MDTRVLNRRDNSDLERHEVAAAAYQDGYRDGSDDADGPRVASVFLAWLVGVLMGLAVVWWS